MSEIIEHPMQSLPIRLKQDLSNLRELKVLLENKILIVTEAAYNALNKAVIEQRQELRPGHTVVVKNLKDTSFRFVEMEPMYCDQTGYSFVYRDTIQEALGHAVSLRLLIHSTNGYLMDLVVLDFDDSDLIGALREAGYAPILTQYVEDELKPRRAARELSQLQADPIVKPGGLLVKMIVATDTDRAIGKGNSLPWKHKGDMQCFRKNTTGNIVVMGRKTFQSMGSKPLPNRYNIVLTSSPVDEELIDLIRTLRHKPGTYLTFCHTVDVALKIANYHRTLQLTKGRSEPSLFVIGGETIYKAFLPVTDILFHNVLELKVDGADSWFPEIDPDEWFLNHQIRRPAEGDDVAWREQVYVRRPK